MSTYDSSASIFLSAHSDMSSSFDLSYCCDGSDANHDLNSRDSLSQVQTEAAEYWNSLSLSEKVRGALLSLLIGGGTGALIGYIMMY